jgi:hypothetical protein
MAAVSPTRISRPSIGWDKSTKCGADETFRRMRSDNRYNTKIPWAPQRNATEVTREECDALWKSVETLESKLEQTLGEIGTLKTENYRLKTQFSNLKEQELWQQSDRNVDMLEQIYKTSNVKVETSEQALSELRGILKDCKKGGENSVMLVRSVREE